ncbi:unnamed protein product [Pieris macdunnoughi]|uniref:Uncharacterized protein n=1 Tax=Pieris macdunnoughi TaxID=345717 RepID=A0A821QV19_9NEOP|nr:unnamed protein product [Pieris macdunnoughi]
MGPLQSAVFSGKPFLSKCKGTYMMQWLLVTHLSTSNTFDKYLHLTLLSTRASKLSIHSSGSGGVWAWLQQVPGWTTWMTRTGRGSVTADGYLFGFF